MHFKVHDGPRALLRRPWCIVPGPFPQNAASGGNEVHGADDIMLRHWFEPMKTVSMIEASTTSVIPCLNLHECRADLVNIFPGILRREVGISTFLDPFRQWWFNQFRFVYDNCAISCKTDNAPHVVVALIRHSSNFINRSKFWTINHQTNDKIEFTTVKSSLWFC